MCLLVFMLYFIFSFTHLSSLEIAGSDYGLSSPSIFAAYHGEFQIVSFVHF